MSIATFPSPIAGDAVGRSSCCKWSRANTALPCSPPRGQKHSRTEKCLTWGWLLCSTREQLSSSGLLDRINVMATSSTCRTLNQFSGQSCHHSGQGSSTSPETARHRFTRVLETSQAVSFYFLKKENQQTKHPPPHHKSPPKH